MDTIKKINLWRLLMLLFAAVAISTSVTACGDDDGSNEPDGGNKGDNTSSMSKKLVGLWIDEDGEYSKFNSDGTGWMYASDEYGSSDIFDDYRISAYQEEDEVYYVLEIKWHGQRNWDEEGAIMIESDGTTFFLSYGSEDWLRFRRI